VKLYNDYNSYLKEKFGQKVYRIGLDAGFSCPNRDGTKGYGGCAYCNETGSRSSYTEPGRPVAEQLKQRIQYLKTNKGAQKFIAYFQAFTNTYAHPEVLKRTYDNVLGFEEIVGISIGTRPDAIDRDKLEIISSYKKRYDVWIEYGAQSTHDRTLAGINRGHKFCDFVDAVGVTKEFGISICAHIIVGLPGESRNDIIDTAKKLSSLKINGVKIHLLHILKGSKYEQLYREGKIKVMGQGEYSEAVCDFLEHLSRDIIIQRLTGQGAKQYHAAPDWAHDKTATIRQIEETLKTRKSFQGKLSDLSPVL